MRVPYPAAMPDPARLARARFRAWHRGTREADYMIGGFFDRYQAEWDEAGLGWFEALLEHEDVDILAWALGTATAPEAMEGGQMALFRRVDYVQVIAPQATSSLS